MPFLRAQLPEAPPPAAAQSAADLWSAPDFSVDPKALYQAASAVAAPEGVNVVEFADDESFTFDESGRTVQRYSRYWCSWGFRHGGAVGCIQQNSPLVIPIARPAKTV